MKLDYLIRLGVVGGALVMFGCGSDGGGGGGGDTPDASVAPGDPDAAVQPGDWQNLITGSWTLGAGREDYWCARITAPEDIYISNIRALSPLGTHHTVVTLSDGGADGEFPCDAGTLADEMIFASGVGSDELAFPSGVAVKIAKGRKIEINIHLFNVSDQEIAGVTGAQVKLVSVADVQQEAENLFAGTAAISIEPGETKTITGWCTFVNPATVVAVWPHMHQLGTHMKVVYEKPGGDVIWHDSDFDFNDQLNYTIAPIEVGSGEKVRVECTYQNTGTSRVTFGDSSNDEMCFAGLYRYPKDGSNLFCVSGFPPL